jgi:L-malate glycosyltransferase
MNKAPQSYWDKHSEQVEFEPLPVNDPIRLLINKYIPANNSGTAFEAGCYPGRFLAAFGDLGYTLHGIDTTPRVIEVPLILQKRGYHTGSIENDNFFQLPAHHTYNVFSSFGFIEHFENYPEVIEKHCLHVKNNGYLVISAPNLRYGIPYYFHRWLNSNSFKQHVLASMRPSIWKQEVKKNGLDVVFAGYCGGLDVWQSGEQNPLQKIISKSVIYLLRLIKIIFFWVNFNQLNGRYISCDFIVIAKKKA